MQFEPVYIGITGLARTIQAVFGWRFVVSGTENIPKKGGALVAVNHTGYLDFFFSGMPIRAKHRYPRFMAKQEIFENSVAGPLMRSMNHIPVDRIAGQDAIDKAVKYLQKGEIVVIFPEGTMSNSWEIKEMKTGAVRMAQEGGVKIYPVIVWGSHRVWRRGTTPGWASRRIPVMVHYCEPLDVDGDPQVVTDALRATMQRELEKLQQEYIATFGPFEEGLPWMPARLGGSAPTLEEAQEQDDRIDAERARARRMLINSKNAAREVHAVALTAEANSAGYLKTEQRLDRLQRMREAAEKLAASAKELEEASQDDNGEEVKRKSGTGSLRNMTEMVATAAVELERAVLLSTRSANRKLGASQDSMTDFATGFRLSTTKSLSQGANFLADKAQSLLSYLQSAEQSTYNSAVERRVRHAISREARYEQAAADQVRRENANYEDVVRQAQRQVARQSEQMSESLSGASATESHDEQAAGGDAAGSTSGRRRFHSHKRERSTTRSMSALLLDTLHR